LFRRDSSIDKCKSNTYPRALRWGSTGHNMAKDYEFIRLKAKEADSDDDVDFPVRGAIATFLFKVMPVDGHTHHKELDRLTRILADDFSLSTEEAEKLVSHARAQENSRETLEKLAALLKERVAKKELLIFISHMWEMVFADGKLHESEVLFVERIASLLDIPQEEVAAAMTDV